MIFIFMHILHVIACKLLVDCFLIISFVCFSISATEACKGFHKLGISTVGVRARGRVVLTHGRSG
jgi:hypothetical protein